MQVLLLLGHIKLAQVCSGSVLYENFGTQLKFVMFTRYIKNVSCIQNLLPVLSTGYF